MAAKKGKMFGNMPMGDDYAAEMKGVKKAKKAKKAKKPVKAKKMAIKKKVVKKGY
jgi:hypothetical protein